MKTLQTNFPTGDALPRAHAPRAKRIKRKVGRSYAKLGTATVRDENGRRTPGFFPLPITWGDTVAARDIRAHAGERTASPGKAPRVEFPLPWSPDAGTVVKGCPTTIVGAGVSLADRTVGRTPSPNETTRFLTDGNNEARDLRRKAIVRAMIKAR